MTFRGDYYPAVTGKDGDVVDLGENLYHDVKDFNWLRTLVQSPNFVVVRDGSQKVQEGRGVDDDPVVDDDANVSGQEQQKDQEQEQGGSSDDEDEL